MSDEKWRIREYYGDMADQTLASLRLFHVELLAFNKKLNLISSYTESNADIVHFYDCIKACIFAQKDSKINEYFDVGSGNGLPGLVFAILNPDKKICIVEKDDRRAEFLKHTAGRLSLQNTQIMNIAPENISTKSPQAVFSRGYSNLARTLLLGNKVFQKGSIIYSLKGPDWFSELSSLPSQICSTWNTEMALEYDLPENLGTKVILKSTRIS